MTSESEEVIAELLAGVVANLDLPAAMQNTANQIYDDVGLWLSDHLDEGSWHFYPQGSMRLGTVVRPTGSDEYDIDAVALLATRKESITQQELKEQVGMALRSYVKAQGEDSKIRPISCDEGRRCWTLEFDDPFHMDVLPAIPDVSAPPSGILLSDRDFRLWLPSDPIAYSEWFFIQMQPQLRAEKAAFAKRAQVDIDDVPDWQVRTVLQRVVQVLKAHRNGFFAGNLDQRPASIVVTTLAAHAFSESSTLYETVMETVSRMSEFLVKDGSRFIVANPVQEEENFADRWDADDGQRFNDWLVDLEATLEAAAATKSGLDSVVETLSSRFTKSAVRSAAKEYAAERTDARRRGELFVNRAGILGGAGIAVKDHRFHGA